MVQDLSLLIKIKEGDIGAFEHVFRSNYSPLLFYSIGITKRRDVSEEIVQDIFYYLWKERENIQILRSLKGYLYASVRNRSLQYCEHEIVDERYRKQNSMTADYGLEADGQEMLEYRELEEIVRKSMEKMPERRLRIFRMHRFENKKYIEIAEALSLSVKTIESEIGKALKTLRKEIEYHTSILL